MPDDGGLLGALGEGFRGMAAVASPDIAQRQSEERANILPNLLRGLTIAKAQRELQADEAFSKAIGGMQPSGFKTSADFLDAFKGVPLDVIANSPSAQSALQMAGQMQQREALQQQRQQALQVQYDRLDQQRQIAEERAQDMRASAEERARANLANEQLRAQMIKMQDAARQANIDLRRELAQDRKQQMEEGRLTPEEANFMARQAWAGDTSVFQNIGRGSQGSENIKIIRKAMVDYARANNKTPEELAAKNAEFFGIKAGERTAGIRSANVEIAVSEAQNIMPIALQASEKVDRTKYPNINSVLQAAQKGTGDEDVVRLASATNALINVYSRAISVTGTPTVSDKDHAREIIDKAYSKGQYKAVLDIMKQEMEAARKAPGQVRQELRSAVTGDGEKHAAEKKKLTYDPTTGTFK